MALADFVLALCALLGTLLIPFCVLYQLLRLKRRAARVAAAVPLTAPRDGRV
jgi:4-amino-4-deoxy-L-arabinose transferase-like glycosyltransferase